MKSIFPGFNLVNPYWPAKTFTMSYTKIITFKPEIQKPTTKINKPTIQNPMTKINKQTIQNSTTKINKPTIQNPTTPTFNHFKPK
jgi:hypothetical protein